MFYWDFLAGFALMNAMPHLLFGLFRIRFLSAFGFSAAANLAYAFVNILIAAVVFAGTHGLAEFLHAGVLWGGIAMFVVYLLSGRYFYGLFNRSSSR